MKTSKLSFLLLSLLFVFANCKDDTAIDLNNYYIKCKVNGITYVPDNCANCMQSDLIGDTTLIIAANRGIENLSIGVKDLSLIKVIAYHLNGEINHRGTYKNSTIVQDRFFTDLTHTGQLTITKLDKLPG